MGALRARCGAGLRSLLLAAATGVLAACAQAPMQTAATPVQHRPALGAFQAEGKIAWSQNGKGESARFSWESRGADQSMDLLTPLGSVAAHIDARPGFASLETSDGQRFTATSLEALSLRVFDMQLPLTGMEYWAQGLPVPGLPYTEETLPEGRRIVQGGLTLDYPRWVEVDGIALPSLIEIRSNTLTLKLLIRQWTTRLPAKS